MSKKKISSPYPSLRRHLGVALQLVLTLTVLACILAFLHTQSHQTFIPLDVPEEELQSFVGTPKVAFLFLAREGLPLDLLWHPFFAGADSSSFSVYVHSRPGFVFGPTTTRSSFFYGRQIENSVPVGWGEASMIEAERLLLRAALLSICRSLFFEYHLLADQKNDPDHPSSTNDSGGVRVQNGIMFGSVVG